MIPPLALRLISPAETNALLQVLESRVWPQIVECRAEQNRRIKALLISALQEGHRLVKVIQTYVDQGDLGRVRIALI